MQKEHFNQNVKLKIVFKGVTGYLKLGGQVVMQHTAAVRRRLIFCQKLSGQLPTLPTRQLRPWSHISSRCFLRLWGGSNISSI